jgi:hypothetical protein
MRTAVGRLYYAVHLQARESLSHRGYSVPRFQAHKAVITELRRRGHPGADMVKRLKRLREDSDYDLATPVTAHEVSRALALANHLWPIL